MWPFERASSKATRLCADAYPARTNAYNGNIPGGNRATAPRLRAEDWECLAHPDLFAYELVHHFPAAHHVFGDAVYRAASVMVAGAALGAGHPDQLALLRLGDFSRALPQRGGDALQDSRRANHALRFWRVGQHRARAGKRFAGIQHRDRRATFQLLSRGRFLGTWTSVSGERDVRGADGLARLDQCDPGDVQSGAGISARWRAAVALRGLGHHREITRSPRASPRSAGAWWPTA